MINKKYYILLKLKFIFLNYNYLCFFRKVTGDRPFSVKLINNAGAPLANVFTNLTGLFASNLNLAYSNDLGSLIRYLGDSPEAIYCFSRFFSNNQKNIVESYSIYHNNYSLFRKYPLLNIVALKYSLWLSIYRIAYILKKIIEK